MAIETVISSVMEEHRYNGEYGVCECGINKDSNVPITLDEWLTHLAQVLSEAVRGERDALVSQLAERAGSAAQEFIDLLSPGATLDTDAMAAEVERQVLELAHSSQSEPCDERQKSPTTQREEK